jgi:hypothetical protein
MRSSRFVPVAGLLLAAACSDTSTTAPAAPSQVSLGTGGIYGGTGVAGLYGRQQGNDVVANAGPMIYHGGPIVPTMKVAAIYWATTTIYAGGPAPGTNGPGSADGSLLGHFMRNLGGSPYYNINTTYNDLVGGGHTVANTLTYTQYWADNTSVPPSTGSAVSNATIKAEIAKGFSTGKLTYDPNTIYAVFTVGKTNLGGGFGSSYCAYHGKFNINGQATLYAAMPFDNAFAAGCSTRQRSPNADPAADREASTLAHEIEEANTDPQLNAWYDASGQENADKCAYTYGTTYVTGNGGVANMNLGGKDFLIQQNWINISGGGNCATQF